MQSNRRVAARDASHSPSARAFPYLKPARGLKIAHVGTYPPRKCGIATYTQDVVSAVHAATPAAPPQLVAMVTSDEANEYGWPVTWQIDQDDPEEYEAVAHAIRAAGVDLVSIQHEHGIYGGDHGDMLNRFVDALGDIPVVTTLHTVLPDPEPGVVRALRGIIARSARIVVLNSRAIPLLADAYGADTSRVVVIPHGTPEVDPSRRMFVRQALGVAGRTVVSTFGLLSPGKGLEHAVAAVAKVAPRFPDLHYYILGRTHPGIVRHSGEAYREELARRATEAGIADRIHFVNEYLSLDALTDWLLATDLYVTPYLNPNQIVSGTLAYAVAAGKAVISTPYLHAQELLEGGRGVLTPFSDPDAMAANLETLLCDPARRGEMESSAWEFGKTSAWPQVARRYWDVFCQAAGLSAGEAPAIAAKAPEAGTPPAAPQKPNSVRHVASSVVPSEGRPASGLRGKPADLDMALEAVSQDEEEIERAYAISPPINETAQPRPGRSAGATTVNEGRNAPSAPKL